jgi:hypothetical protein
MKHESKEGLRIVDGVLIIPEGTTEAEVSNLVEDEDAWTSMKAHGGFTRIQFPKGFTSVYWGKFEWCASLKEAQL